MEPKKENRQNTPSKIMREKQEFRLAFRKKKIEEVIWAQRYPTNPIKGYDLTKYSRRHHFKKRCWLCGAYNHMKVDCPLQEKNKLRARVAKLERKVSELMEALKTQMKNKEKRLKKKKKKQKKKKQRKNKKKAEAQNTAVKLKILLYKEEKTWAGNFVTTAASILDKLPNKAQTKVKKAYKELFSQDLTDDITKCFCEGDEFYETYEQQYGDLAPLDPKDQQTLQTRIKYVNNLN